MPGAVRGEHAGVDDREDRDGERHEVDDRESPADGSRIAGRAELGKAAKRTEPGERRAAPGCERFAFAHDGYPHSSRGIV